MFPQRNPIFSLGRYVAHEGKVAADSSTTHWVEGPAAPGAPGIVNVIAPCWDALEAVTLVQKLVADELTEAENVQDKG